MSETAALKARGIEPNGAAHGRWLHLVPKLYLRKSVWPRTGASGICLDVTSSALAEAGIAVTPFADPAEVAICPDARCFVGALAGGRYGWLVPIPVELQVIDVRYSWMFPGVGFTGAQEVEHRILFHLLPGTSNLYSTETASWGERRSSSCMDPPSVEYCSVSTADDLSTLRTAAGAKLEAIVDWGDPDQPGRETGLRLTEAIDLQAVPWSSIREAESFNGGAYDRSIRGFEQ